MCRSIVIALCACLVSVSSFALGQAESPEIKVRILKLESSFSIVGIGLRFSGAPGAPAQSLSILPVKRTAVVSYLNGQWTVSNNERTLTFVGSKLEVMGESLSINRMHLPPSGFFSARARKTLPTAVDFVARLSLEDYLVDVVSSEMPFNWPLEALKAQAVTARSYALSIMKERRLRQFHVDSSTSDQVYQYGRSLVNGLALHLKMREAVDSTRDVKLVDRRGRVLKSYFHAHCGGETEEPREVWGVGPKFGIVNDSGCALSGQWKAQIPFSEMGHRLLRTRNDQTPMTIQNIELKYKMGSSRVQDVMISALEGRIKMRAQNFRAMFGYDRVKSTLFTARVENNILYLEGRGHGHGVGMCQTGARMMAMAGANYEQILSRYYRNARIVKPIIPESQQVLMRAQASLERESVRAE